MAIEQKVWRSPSDLVLVVQSKASEECEKHLKEVGTSLKDKLERARKAKDATLANLKVLGISEVTDEVYSVISTFVVAEGLRAHYQAQYDKAEAERKAREAKEKTLAMLMSAIEGAMAQAGSLDPDKVREFMIAKGLLPAQTEAPKSDAEGTPQEKRG